MISFRQKNLVMATQKEIIQAAHCPNCWGHQDYNDRVISPVISHQKNVLNRIIKDGFIRRFMVRFVEGIKLK